MNALHVNTSPLNRLYFYLTEGCNLGCRHCWLSPPFTPDGETKSSLPVELFETAIREAKLLGLQSVKLTGGEPLLHPQFLELLKIVRQEKLALNIESNGVLCTAEIAAEIAKSSRRFVSISLDGAEAATHDEIRGVKGSFVKACQAIEYLAAANTPPQVIMSLMRSNVSQVEALVRLVERLGASSVKFNLIEPTGRGEHLHSSHKSLDIKELIEIGHHVETELSQSAKIPLWFSYPLAFRPLSRIASHGLISCDILGILGILPSGEYALCGIGTHVKDLIFGQVGNVSLEELWQNNTVLKELRDGLPDTLSGVCAHCLMKASCLGSCIAQTYYRTQKLTSSFWFCEQAERQGLFPKSRLVINRDPILKEATCDEEDA